MILSNPYFLSALLHRHRVLKRIYHVIDGPGTKTRSMPRPRAGTARGLLESRAKETAHDGFGGVSHDG
jgi:hypothetical protein